MVMMMTHPFNSMYEKDKHVLVISHNRRISMKDAREIGNAIKGKSLSNAINFLEKVIKLKQPIEFRRYTEGAGHKKGLRHGGRYPVNASKEIVKLLRIMAKNAEYKGFDVDNVYIKYFVVSKGFRFYRPRRIRFRPQKSKSTNVYILGEVKAR